MNDDTSLITEKYKAQVMEQLEKTGVLGKLRAQLKSNVMKVLESQPKAVKQNLEFDYLTQFQKQVKTKDMILAVHLMKEFLEYYEMEYTIPVFENETNIREKLQKESLIKEVGIQNYDEKQPLLLNLLSSYYFFKENFNNNQQINTTNQLNKTASLNPNDSKFSSLKNQPSNNEEIVEAITEIREKTNNNVSEVNDGNKIEPIKSKKLPPIIFSANNDSSENNSPVDKKNEKLKKFDENSPTNKKVTGGLSTGFSSTNFSNLGDIQANSVSGTANSNSINLNQTVKKANSPSVPNSTVRNNETNNLSSNKLSNLSNQNVNEMKDDILEEIDLDSVEDIEDKNDKKNSSGSGIFAASQTFGYDNSVTSYNLDFYDYIEDVEK